jgi:hypothetical protein
MTTIDRTTEAQAIAATTIQQLGGAGRLQAMVGASHFTVSHEQDGTVVRLAFRFKMNRRMNYCQVTYRMCPDIYDVRFFKLPSKIGAPKLVSEHCDIYCDQLVELFERETGLYLTL